MLHKKIDKKTELFSANFIISLIGLATFNFFDFFYFYWFWRVFAESAIICLLATSVSLTMATYLFCLLCALIGPWMFSVDITATKVCVHTSVL